MRQMLRNLASLLALSATLLEPLEVSAISLEGFTENEKEIRLSIMQKLNPLIEERKLKGNAAIMTFEELYAPLKPSQIEFLEEFKKIDPVALGGASRRLPPPAPETRFIKLDKQVMWKEGKAIKIDTQFLPEKAHQAYLNMMKAMEEDLGKRLLVESGYRSPAYQLFLFLFYMPKHGYSIQETNRHVALPGCSEHGSPVFQAIDFITPQGINGEDRPEEFEELQEYGWLHARAKKFGFHLSYPRPSAGSGQAASAFEPWHWHYEER